MGEPVTFQVNAIALPHVVAGTASIGEDPAPDGTVVSAMVSLGQAYPITIGFVAVDSFFREATTSMEVQVIPQQVEIARAVVEDGKYKLNVVQILGRGLAGKTISFRIGEDLATETTTWESGKIQLIELNADSSIEITGAPVCIEITGAPACVETPVS